jgi:hypothetical protein
MLPATADRSFHRLSHLKKRYREHPQRFALVAVELDDQLLKSLFHFDMAGFTAQRDPPWHIAM